jgi:hypothetical protein
MMNAKLRGRIREVFGQERAFANAIGMGPSMVSLCLNGKRQWRGPEIAAACQALGIPLADAYQYNFFC